MKQWNKNSFLSGRFDLQKIGMFGHSFGGITTSFICTEEDTPVLAGINIDAALLIYGEEELKIQRPFAFFYSTNASLGRAGTLNMWGSNDYFRKNTNQPTWSVSMKKTAHYNYSDFNLMPPILKLTPMLGAIDGQRMTRLLRRYVLDFFDFTLKGKEGTPYSTRSAPEDDVILE